MARTSNSSSRRRDPSSNPALIPVSLAVDLIVGAVVVAMLTKKPKEVVDASPSKPKPFAEMPPEAPPPPREHKPGSNLPMAPDGLATEPQWLKAQVLAAEAKVLYEAAVSAKAKGDQALANEKGGAARDKYNAAVEATAEWEESILSKYNENDSKVRAIKDTRTDWFNKLRFLEKSVAH